MAEFILSTIIGIAVGFSIGVLVTYNFLAFGIKTNPEKFQKILDEARKINQ